MDGPLTCGGDVAAAVEDGREDVLGTVEKDQSGRELPRLCPRRHGQSGDLGTRACARSQAGRRRCRMRKLFARGMYGQWRGDLAWASLAGTPGTLRWAARRSP